MKETSILLGLFIYSQLEAQPYLDIAKLNYSYTPKSGLGTKTNSLQAHFYSINVTVPIELRKDGDAFIINPFFDHNQGDVSARDFNIVSQGALLGFLKKDVFRNWDVLSSFILRRNKGAEKKIDDPWQYGGFILTTWNKNQFASLKFGVYYNREFFGNFFMPLAGIDWKINKQNKLFGVLPGSMTFEHQVSASFYLGTQFRALTNSYRLETIDPCRTGDCSGSNYLRIDDNQLGGFADLYLTRKFVLSAEAGYTILRRYRFGFKGDDLHLKTDNKSDNFYFRAGVAYRIRLR